MLEKAELLLPAGSLVKLKTAILYEAFKADDVANGMVGSRL